MWQPDTLLSDPVKKYVYFNLNPTEPLLAWPDQAYNTPGQCSALWQSGRLSRFLLKNVLSKFGITVILDLWSQFNIQNTPIDDIYTRNM